MFESLPPLRWLLSALVALFLLFFRLNISADELRAPADPVFFKPPAPPLVMRSAELPLDQARAGVIRCMQCASTLSASA